MNCVFCKKPAGEYGNNPAPASKTGRACDDCNFSIVIPARLQQFMGIKMSPVDVEMLKRKVKK